jgi:hypothetical protein
VHRDATKFCVIATLLAKGSSFIVKLLAWQAIEDEAADLKFDETEKRQLSENIQKAKRDMKEAVWRSFRHLFLLGKDNVMKHVDLGLVHSSAASSPIENILNRLTTDGDFDKGISVRLLVKNWSAAFTEWPTKFVRDAMYASPQFPRILKGILAIQDTISKGVTSGDIAYVGKTPEGKYSPFVYGTGMLPADVEISDDVFIIQKATADAYRALGGQRPVDILPGPSGETGTQPPGGTDDQTGKSPDSEESGTQPELFAHIAWSGEIPPQKWMNFYTRVVSKFGSGAGVKLKVTLEVSPEGGTSKQKIEEAKTALRELGLDPTIST